MLLRTTVSITSVGGTAYTEPFQTCQKIAAQFNIKTTRSGGTLTAMPQTSADGVNWLDKTALSLTASGVYSGSAVTALFGGDSGSVPHHPLMRLKLSSTQVIDRVVVLVHGRGRSRFVFRELYKGVVPTNTVYSRAFSVQASARSSAVHAIATPIGASTTPAISVQLQMSHDENNWQNQQASPEINGTSLVVRQEGSAAGLFNYSGAYAPIARLALTSGSGSLDNCNFVRVYTTDWIKDDSIASPMIRSLAPGLMTDGAGLRSTPTIASSPATYSSRRTPMRAR
jgi:hypothetical protein